MSKKAAFKTLGCRLNQFETDSIITDFHKAGYNVVDFNEEADVYVVNTCTVTNQGDQKSKYAINKALKTGAKNALMVVTGCMVTSQKEYLENREDITYVVDNKRKKSVFPLVESHFNGEMVHPSDLQQDVFGFSVVEKGFHTRSSIKVQDGCDNYCTYCIVPKVRGRAVSRPFEDIKTNIEKVISLGRKEIVLTGVNISRYDYKGMNFEGLVERILNLKGDFRIRISSIEPEGFTEKFIDLFENPKLCPHLHLCLQSGSDKVLMRMRRFYTMDYYKSLIEKFRSRYPDFNFTTDIITGFPGETEEEFEESCNAIKEIGFGHTHTFKYSKRTGTRADRMPEQIDAKTKTARGEKIRDLAEEMKYEYRKSFIGKEQWVLIEKSKNKEENKGYGQHFLPIEIKSHDKLQWNSFVKVKVTDVRNDKEKTMIGVPV